MVKNPKASLS